MFVLSRACLGIELLASIYTGEFGQSDGSPGAELRNALPWRHRIQRCIVFKNSQHSDFAHGNEFLPTFVQKTNPVSVT